MESKKINQLATNVNPQTSDLTTIGDPITGQLKKITWLQIAHLIGAQASVTLQQVTDNGNETTDPITTGGLTLTNIGTGILKNTNGTIDGVYGYGLANGVATLDSGGKIPAAQLPSSVMEYKGTWNASTNTPTLADGTGDNGDVYLVNVAGSQNLGSGTISFAVGDWVVYNGTIWQKSLNSNAVASVFGRTGTITAQEGDYNIDQLGDVAITSAASNDYLRYNGSGWVNTPFPTFVSSDKLIITVRNNSGATINKGTVVYINGATAGYPTIAKAQANADATSAQTIGMVQDNISNNSNGYVVIVGQITSIDTSAYSEGTQLYLSPTTAGAVTSTKPYAPSHLVYIGIVTTSNAVNGVIEIKVQNGYELDEIHDVSAQNPSNNDGIFYNSTSGLWEKKSISTVLGYTPEQPLIFSSPLSRSTNTISIPVATSSANGYLSSTDWTTFNNKLTSPMTTLGDIIYGGTSGTATRLAGNTTTAKQYLSQTGNGTVSAAPSWATITGSDITGAALTKSDDTNVTLTLGGSASTSLLRAASLTLGWTGQLSIARGGTGASTAIAAFNALSPLTTLGDILYHDGTNNARLGGNTTATKKFLTQTGDGSISAVPIWGTISGTDVSGAALTKTDDTNVTLTLGGTPATSLLRAASLTLGWTGQLAVSRGGTGASSFTANQILYGNGTSAITSSSTFIYNPTAQFTVSNNATTGLIGVDILSTVNALANNDILYGVRINPTFSVGSFTGVTQRALGVFGNVYINGNITGAGWQGAVIGSSYGGAGTVSGIMKANGSGTVSAAVAGTDYVAPSALSSYLPLSGGTLTGALSGTSATFSNSSTSYAINATSAYTNAVSNNPIITFGRAGSAVAGAIGYDDNLGSLYIGTTTNHNFLIKTNNTLALTIASTGAATFSSSVTATQYAATNTSASSFASLILNNDTSKDFQILTFGSSRGDTVFGQAVANWAVQYTTSASGLAIGTYNNTDFILGTNNTNRITIKAGGNVGIGTSSPTFPLTINKAGAVETGNAYGIAQFRDASANKGIDLGYDNTSQTGIILSGTTATASELAFWTYTGSSWGERMRITSSGEIWMGYTTDQGAYLLQVNGSVYASAYYESSDVRLKNILTTKISDNFSAIEFMWKDERDSKKHWGYAAQDVIKFIPDAIEVNKDGMMTVNYNEAHTWKIAQLEAKIKELESKLAN